MFPFLFNQSRSTANIVNQASHLFFEAQKDFFLLFLAFGNDHIQHVDQRCETQHSKYQHCFDFV